MSLDLEAAYNVKVGRKGGKKSSKVVQYKITSHQVKDVDGETFCYFMGASKTTEDGVAPVVKAEDVWRVKVAGSGLTAAIVRYLTASAKVAPKATKASTAVVAPVEDDGF